MKIKPIATSLLLSFFLLFNCSNHTTKIFSTKGHLFIIGGGKRPDSVMKKFIQLADGFDKGKILVLPMASGDPMDVGMYQANQMTELGAKNVSFLFVTREEAMMDSSVQKLNGATGIFFSGGSQTRLVEAIGGTPFEEKIHQLYQQGAVIGGTSAGAAVMSEIMITGDEKRPDERKDRAFNRIEGANIVTETGFGFLKNMIIDQHFIRRKRHNRLISLVLENTKKVGIGIDESTALIVYPDLTLEIIGENSVIFYDARNSQPAPFDSTKSYNLAASNIKMHILTDGYRINLITNEIIDPDYEEN
ncbi:cyanophycinase [candidate division KSB1 bacterium 4572_119]|nr:MAG: cyanophycinase [candidate division KSB1 bacterium 4572_119]